MIFGDDMGASTGSNMIRFLSDYFRCVDVCVAIAFVHATTKNGSEIKMTVKGKSPLAVNNDEKRIDPPPIDRKWKITNYLLMLSS